MWLQNTLPIWPIAGGTFVALLLYHAIASALLARRRSSWARSQGCLPPPKFRTKDKLLGTDLFLQNVAAIKEHRFLQANADQFGVVGTNTFFMHAVVRRTHMTMEPENLKAILSTDFKRWGFPAPRKMGFRPLLGNGIFTTEGLEWQHSRGLLRPSFTRSEVGDLAKFERHIQNLMAVIPENGRTVDLSELFFRLTIDSATDHLFGKSTESLLRTGAEGFSDSFSRAQGYILTLSRFGGLARMLLPRKQFNKDRKLIHDFVDHYVGLALKRRPELLAANKQDTPEHYLFMEELAQQTSDPVQIRSELLNILLAGRDTTASLLTNAWLFISQRPDIWRRLQDEVATLQGRRPSFEELKNLPYLKALMNESLRLFPVIPMNAREAQEDTILPRGGGPDAMSPLFIPKGGVVAWNVYAMHRRKDLYGPDAEEFRPERWLDESGRKGLRTGWEYLPFNGGPRICLGQQFALTEAYYTTVRLCQVFSGIECRDDDPVWRENLTLTCVNLNGAKIALTRRG